MEDPTYFIAEIGINHDGDLERALRLIYLAKEAGADCVKFQNYKVDSLLNEKGIIKIAHSLGNKINFKDYSFIEDMKKKSTPLEWTPYLKQQCEKLSIEYMTTPYDIDDLDYLNNYSNAFKVGSGDVTWHEFLKKIAAYGKPILLSTGASSYEDVSRAFEILCNVNEEIVLMQCNSNYSGDDKNYSYVNLNVLKTYSKAFPNAILGLSDHTLGYATVLGAVSLGARVIEKHFTDEKEREGPDHKISLTLDEFKVMVNETRRLEKALGDGIKRVEENEQCNAIIMKRSIQAKKSIKAGKIIQKDDIISLRPAPHFSFKPYEISKVVGKKAKIDINRGTMIEPEIIE